MIFEVSSYTIIFIVIIICLIILYYINLNKKLDNFKKLNIEKDKEIIDFKKLEEKYYFRL